MTRTPAFSVAICTFNRAGLLRQALASFAACAAPTGAWELVVVDNNSTDQTRAVAESFAASLPLRCVREAQQGLSHARNRALAECASEVLLFTDDDVTFEHGWLRDYEHAFANQAKAGWFGGRVVPNWPDGRPTWLRDEGMALIAGLLVRYDLGPADRAYERDDPEPFGASFALRRSAFEAGGAFRIDLGVNGNVPGRGEEVEYVARLRRAGFSGFYVGASSARHWQDPRRFTWRYLYRYGIQKGIAEARLDERHRAAQPALRRDIEYVLKAGWQLLKRRGDRSRQCVINMGMQRGLRLGANDSR